MQKLESKLGNINLMGILYDATITGLIICVAIQLFNFFEADTVIEIKEIVVNIAVLLLVGIIILIFLSKSIKNKINNLKQKYEKMLVNDKNKKLINSFFEYEVVFLKGIEENGVTLIIAIISDNEIKTFKVPSEELSEMFEVAVK